MSFDSDDSDIKRNSSSDEDNLFADEPLANEAWTARYEQELIAYMYV